MEAFELVELVKRRGDAGQPYLEFLRSESMSIGLYELAASEPDPQEPHREDEAYIILRGRATIRVGGEEQPVTAGSIVFVRAGVEHRFHDIVEELTVVVVFAPPES